MAMVDWTLQLLGIFVFYHTIWFDGLTYARQIQDHSVSQPKVDPCKPSPCGLNSECRPSSSSLQAICSCSQGYFGNPLILCTPGICIESSDCPAYLTCQGSQCMDPCTIRNMCGQGAECTTINHVPTCTCPPGFTGDASIICWRFDPRIMETLKEMDNIQRSEDNILHEIKRKQHKKQSTSFEGKVGELRVKADNILREMDKQSKNKGISQEKKVMKKIRGLLDYLLPLGNSGSPSLFPIDMISDDLLSLGNSGSPSLSPIDMISDDLLSLGNNGSPSWSPINIISGMQDSSGTCDFTQFGSNHSAVLPPKEKCEKFRMIAGEIYKRGVSEEDIQAILKTHNELRSTVAKGLETRGNPGPQPSGANLRELIWNEQLAVSAQGWADQCAVKHDLKSNRQTCEYKIVGQNCAHKKSRDNKPSTVQWEKIINNLHNEVVYMPNYAVDQQQKPPNGQTGHYTQVVWAKTYEVGCGVVSYYLYKEVKGKLVQKSAKSFVCNYGPPGNYRGAKVYERGPPASKCDNGVSANYPNLCAPPAT